MTDMARYLVGNGDEVVCEMEHFPKHGIASFGSLGIAVTFRIGYGGTLISSPRSAFGSRIETLLIESGVRLPSRQVCRSAL